jgi:hypothetical protein
MANISAFGMGDSVTGVHADIIIADDIITLLDKTSEAERRRTLDFVNEFFRLRKTPKSRIIITGTRWHKQDAWRRIEQFAPPVLYPADKCPWLDSETLQKENSPQDWVLNYLLEYPQDSESVFNNIQYEGFPLDSWKKEKVIMHIDAAYSLHEGGDSTALTILGGNHVLGKLWQGAYFNHIGEFADLFHKYHCCKVYCEDNDRGIAARDLTAAGLPCETYHESRNKANKISSMLKPSVWEALRFSPETDEAYLSQVLDWAYNTKGHDDAPDSLACAVGIRDSKFREQKVSGLFTIGGYQ